MTPDLQAQIDAYKQKYAGTGVLTTDPRDQLAGVMGMQSPIQSTPTVDPNAGKPQGHGMMDWIPGLTGALGGILGGIVGTPADLISGPAGTLVGGAGGAAIGQAGGKWLENLLTGDQTTPGDLAKQAAFGAGGTLVGGAIGKGVGALLGKAGSAISGAAEGRASQTALENLTNELKGVPTKVLQQNKLSDVTGLFNKLNITPSLANFRSAADAVTGENGAVNAIKNELISNAGPVDLNANGGFMDTVQNALDQATLLNKSQKNNIASLMRRELDNTVHQGYQSLDALNGKADPTAVFDAIKNINGYARPLYNSTDPVAQATQSVYKAAAGHLQDALYNNAGADALAAGYKVSPSNLLAISHMTNGDPGLTKYIVDGLNNSNSIQDIRSLEAPFVGASNIARAGEMAGQDFTRNGAEAATTTGAPGMLGHARTAADVAGLVGMPFTGGLSGAIPAIDMAMRVAKNPTVLGAVDSASGKLSDLGGLLGNIINSPLGKALSMGSDQLGAANMAAGGAPLRALTGAASAAGDPNAAPTVPGAPGAAGAAPGATDFSSPTSALNATAAPLATDPNAQSSTPASGYTNDQLAQALQHDLQYNGGRNASKIAQLMRFNQLAERQNLPKFSSYQQQQYAQLQNAQEGMSTLGGLYQQAGGGQGVIGGNLTKLSEKIPFVQNSTKASAAKAYEGQMDEVAATLARVLGGGGGQSGIQKIQALRAQLPELTDSPQAAAMKLKVLNQRLNAAVHNIISAPATNVPGMDSNFSSLMSSGTSDPFADPTSALSGL